MLIEQSEECNIPGAEAILRLILVNDMQATARK
jgi:hypothetical protein